MFAENKIPRRSNVIFFIFFITIFNGKFTKNFKKTLFFSNICAIIANIFLCVMPQFTEIVSELERVFPKRLQEDYDNAGVQVFAGEGDITQCLVTLDVTEKVVDEAIHSGCNLIVAHHPIIFGRGLMNISPETSVGRIVLKAVKNSVSIYCAHTNADAMPAGTVAFMFEKLGIKEFSMLKRWDSEDFECGAGGIGELPK